MDLLLAELKYSDGWQLDIKEYIEEYSEIIWTTRWNACGDFVLTVPSDSFKTISDYKELINKIIINKSATDNISSAVPDDYMIIEKITLTYDVTLNQMLMIEGRNLLSILERRIIWGQQSFRSSQTLKSACDIMVNNAIISPSDSNRKIDAFKIGTYSASRTIEASQVSYDNLLDTLIDVCGDDYSPQVILDGGYFVFSLYQGADRTINSNDPMIFSQRLENLEKYEYIKDISTFKNAWLCAGDGEGAQRKKQSNYWNSGTDEEKGIGLYRRELYIDARNISSEDSSGTIPTATYNKMLLQCIEDKRLKTWIEELSTAELNFGDKKYGKDYSVGDRASLVDSVGAVHTIRITEFIRCASKEGYKEYPNFELL